MYWVGKQQGPGWQDNIQNQLVESALKLACFEQIDDCEKSCGLQSSYTCTNCGVEWNYFSVEWRMLAFHRRLVKVGADDRYRNRTRRNRFGSGFAAAGEVTAYSTLLSERA